MTILDPIQSYLIMYDYQLLTLIPKLTSKHLEQLQSAITVELHERDLNNERN